MLRYNADIKTIIYMIITSAVLIIQWQITGINPLIYAVYLFLSVSVSVITHNHNHVQIWKSKFMNTLTDWWLTVFYGFPVFAWIPTHNKNHHKMNNRIGDYTITYRFSEKNNLVTLLSYPTISGFYQQKAIREYLKDLYHHKKGRFFLNISQYMMLILWIGIALLIDWQKAVWFVIIPQQVSLFSVLIFNYVQHVHANEESEYNHSRNFTGFLNFLLFNNGYHTIHHKTAGLHWSKTPAEHEKIEYLIDSSLIERSFWWFILRNYFLGIFIKRFKTDSMRLKRIACEQMRLQAAESGLQGP